MSYQVCGVGRERTRTLYEVAGAHLLLITDVGRQAAQSGVAADPCILDLATAVLAWTHHPWPCNMYRTIYQRLQRIPNTHMKYTSLMRNSIFCYMHTYRPTSERQKRVALIINEVNHKSTKACPCSCPQMQLRPLQSLLSL